MTFQATPVAPETFQTFQSFMTFQPSRQFYNVPVSPGNPPHSSILRLECIFYNSTVRLVSTENSTEYQFGNYRHYIHSSKKGRCCDIGQIDRFSIIELFPLSSCQMIILIARMTFNCFPSCLMSLPLTPPGVKSTANSGMTLHSLVLISDSFSCNCNSINSHLSIDS